MRSRAGGLADVLPSVLSALGMAGVRDRLRLREKLAGVRRVAVLLVDGLGYHLLAVAAPCAPLLAEVVAGRAGTLAELGCAFPSTTPTSLVTFGTGVLPGEHGVLGFTVNVPGTERVLTHIAWADDPPPRLWQPVPSLFDRAAAAGICATVVARPEFAGSGLSRAAYGDARYAAAARSDELAAQILRALALGPGLVYGYHPTLDTMSHLYGIDSDQWRKAAGSVDRLITRVVEGLPPDAALLVTADHGALDVPSEARVDMDRDPRLAAGVRVVAGEPRVRYLHTAPGATPDVLDTWRGVLDGRASVLSRDEAIATDLFGPVPADHAARIGDVVVIGQGPTVVLATAHEPETVSKLVAFHGSTSAVETAIPLITFRGTNG
jgi:hypothetical protein